jgi:hypothetical protein
MVNAQLRESGLPYRIGQRYAQSHEDTGEKESMPDKHDLDESLNELPPVSGIDEDEEHIVGQYLRGEEVLALAIEERDEALDKIIRNAERPQELIDDYTMKAARAHEFSQEVKKLRQQLDKEGWILGEGGGCLVELYTSPRGNQVIEVADAFGQTPVQKGDVFVGDLRRALSVPEAGRKEILNAFTFGPDGMAKDRYCDSEKEE